MLNGGENWTALRLGGDRLTGYNWENNASNAGADYLNESDDYLAQVVNIPPDSSSIPGIVTEVFHNQALQLGAYTLATLQMAGFVAKDKNGAGRFDSNCSLFTMGVCEVCERKPIVAYTEYKRRYGFHGRICKLPGKQEWHRKFGNRHSRIQP